MGLPAKAMMMKPLYRRMEEPLQRDSHDCK